jgi:hypothetical protein
MRYKVRGTCTLITAADCLHTFLNKRYRITAQRHWHTVTNSGFARSKDGRIGKSHL